MAIDVNVWDATYSAYIDLQSSQFAFVKFGAEGAATMCDTSGEAMVGILQNRPRSGQNAMVRHLGVSKLYGAGTIGVNLLLTTDHSGHGLAAYMGSGDYTICHGADLADGKLSEVVVRGTPVRAK